MLRIERPAQGQPAIQTNRLAHWHYKQGCCSCVIDSRADYQSGNIVPLWNYIANRWMRFGWHVSASIRALDSCTARTYKADACSSSIGVSVRLLSAMCSSGNF
jgi:hypothetical protein